MTDLLLITSSAKRFRNHYLQKIFNKLMAQIGSTKTRREISDNDVWNIISASF